MSSEAEQVPDSDGRSTTGTTRIRTSTRCTARSCTRSSGCARYRRQHDRVRVHRGRPEDFHEAVVSQLEMKRRREWDWTGLYKMVCQENNRCEGGKCKSRRDSRLENRTAGAYQVNRVMRSAGSRADDPGCAARDPGCAASRARPRAGAGRSASPGPCCQACRRRRP